MLRGSSCCVAFLRVGFYLFWCLLPRPHPFGSLWLLYQAVHPDELMRNRATDCFLPLGDSTTSVPCSRSSDFGVLGSVLEVSVTFIRQWRSRDPAFGYLLLNPPAPNCITSFQMKYCDFYFREIISYLSSFLKHKMMGIKHKVEGIKVLLFSLKVLWYSRK